MARRRRVGFGAPQRPSHDGARLLLAKSEIAGVRQELTDVRNQYATLAEGQDILSGVLIGRPHKDGTVSIGIAEQTRNIRAKQDESSDKIDAVIADMGDLKTAQADQAKTLTEHGDALEKIEKWIALAVGYLKRALDLAGKGGLWLIGLGSAHLLYLWWPGIANFFSTWGPAASTAASAASRGHLH